MNLDPLAKLLGGERIFAIDVGARGGIMDNWKPFKELLDVMLFETDAAEAIRLKQYYAGDPHVTIASCGLAGETGKRTLYVFNSPKGSSLYPPIADRDVLLRYFREGFVYPLKEQVVEVRDLTGVLGEHAWSRADCIKLDTQGSELEILGGLERPFWESMILVDTEAWFVPLYEGVPHIGTLLDFMEERGFHLWRLSPINTCLKKGGDMDYYPQAVGHPRLHEVAPWTYVSDAVFVNDRLLWGDGIVGHPKLLARAIAVLVMYDFPDHALALCERAEGHGPVTAAQREALRELLRERYARPVPKDDSNRDEGEVISMEREQGKMQSDTKKNLAERLINSIQDGSFVLKVVRRIMNVLPMERYVEDYIYGHGDSPAVARGVKDYIYRHKDGPMMEEFAEDYIRRHDSVKGHANVLRHYSDFYVRFGITTNWPEDVDSFENLAFLFLSSQANFGLCLMAFEEAAYLYRLVRSLPPGRFAEIGRFKGGSTFLMAAAMDEKSTLESYDIHAVTSVYDHKNRVMEISGQELDGELKEALARYNLGEKVHVLVADSTKVKLEAESYDMVLVDGDHSYEGAKNDFLHWKGALKRGGHLLFHDAAKPNMLISASKDVIRLMSEIEADYTDEFEKVGEVGALVHFRKLG